MNRLDLDGLDGSLVLPAVKQVPAGLTARDTTQGGEQLASPAAGDEGTADLTSNSDFFPFSEPRHESADKTGNDGDIEQSKDPLFYDDTEPLLAETAEFDINGGSPNKNLLLQKFIARSKAGNKAHTQNDFDQEDATDAVVPVLKDRLIPDSAAEDIASPPQTRTASTLKRLLKVSAVFVAGILIGGAGLLAWLNIGKELPLVSLIDTPSDPIPQRDTDIELMARLEPANPVVLPQALENAEKYIPMVSDERQVIETVASHDTGNAADESYSQAEDNSEMDRTMPAQETESSQSRSVPLQDKTKSSEKSPTAQQIADEVPQKALPPNPTAQQIADEVPQKTLPPSSTVGPTSWTIPVSFNDLAVPEETVKDLMDEFMQCDKGLIITGHTCSLGNSENNYYVGLARAKSVRKILTELGISIDRLKVDSESDDQPVATNATEQGRRANRRVVISCR